MKIQFYANKRLAEILLQESEEKGVPIGVILNDSLNNYYNLAIDEISVVSLREHVFKEILDFIKIQSPGKQFTLNDASPTFDNIPMTSFVKPAAIRAAIGKEFSKQVDLGTIESVKKVVVNGRLKLSYKNKAIMYEVK